jgi:hypothetical protein
MVTIKAITDSLKVWITLFFGTEGRISAENEEPVFRHELTVRRKVNALFGAPNLRRDNGEFWWSNG